MSHRPVVLPGLVLGVVSLAALTGFAHLPAEDVPTPAAAAAPAVDEHTQLQVNACRTWQTTSASVGLDAIVAQAEQEAAGGTVSPELTRAWSTAWGQANQTFAQIAAHPQVEKAVSTSLTELIAGYQGVSSQLEAKKPSLGEAVDAVSAARGRASDFCTEVDPA